MGFFNDIFGSNNPVSRAEDNYEKRQQIADWNYRAREYVSEGQRIYEEAYGNLVYECSKVGDKVRNFVNYKQQVLKEINATLKSINQSAIDINISSIDFASLDRCAVTQSEQLTCVDKALDTWVVPEISDWFRDVSYEDYYGAKSNMNRAKAYKEQMKTKREMLRNAKYAVRSIPDFLSDEKSQIEQLMEKFRKTANGIKPSEKERADSLCTIANLIAKSLSTQLLDNNYQITQQYQEIHNQISYTNNSLADSAWMLE
ncbi:MAG: hypothetical protein K2G25_02265 [Oscillospiraceae bacterium]|nr:hypothetical protein [Oscillospiraceae bacterium]